MGGVGWVGGVCKVIFVSNPTVVLCCVGVGVLTIYESEKTPSVHIDMISAS